MDKKSIKTIERFLSGEMKPRELQEFKRAMDDNPDLEREVQLRKEVYQALKEKDVIKLRAELQSIHNELNNKALSGKIIQLYKEKTYLVSGVAAAIIIIFVMAGALFFNSGSVLTPDQIFTQYYHADGAVMMERSAADRNNTLKDALIAYQDKDFANAIVLFSEEKDNILAQYYLGMSYLEMGKAERSIPLFQSIISHNENLFIEQANWYLGLCYVKTSQMENAREIFTSISESDNIFNTKAKEILKHL